MHDPFVRQFAHFLNAIAFLSRIPVGNLAKRISSSCATTPEQELENISKSVPYFPLAGLILGIIAVTPLYIGLAKGYPLLQGTLYIAFMAWLTRGLHWDGLTDLGDAMGCHCSADNDERFWKIIKDSHMGALGGLCLSLSVVASIITAGYLIEKDLLLALPLAAALSRTFCLLFIQLAPAHANAKLGAIMSSSNALAPGVATLTILLIIGGVFISWPGFSLAIMLAFIATAYLARIANTHHGYNGDFLGTVIIVTQLATFFGLLLAS